MINGLLIAKTIVLNIYHIRYTHICTYPVNKMDKKKVNSSMISTVVWEKFIVENIHMKMIHGKKFSLLLASDENFLQ